jgi:phospholipid/cholesterol/gamma-HCH transport system substrate-binding protein
MAGQAQQLKIGLFVVIGLVMGVGLLIWLGASHFFKGRTTVVSYFTESVQGLETDSPVKYRGVTVGRVKDIRMASDGKHIEVFMDLNPSFTITEDLGVKIALLGLTGQKYLEMDRFMNASSRESKPPGLKSRHPVIQAYPSDIREFGNALDNIFKKAKGVDIEQISHHLLNITQRVDKITSDPKMEYVGADFADTVREVKQMVKKVNFEMDKMKPSVRVTRTIDKTNDLLEEFKQTTRSLDRLIKRTDNNINRLGQKIERSVDNIEVITRNLRDKPSGIIFGFPEEKKSR